MAVDFSLPSDVENVRMAVREFIEGVVVPAEHELFANAPAGSPSGRT